MRINEAEDYSERYVNSVQIRATLHDFQFLLGRISPDPKTNQPVLTNFETLFLSPSQAKALLHILRSNVEAYESEFGSITLPALPRLPAIQDGGGRNN